MEKESATVEMSSKEFRASLDSIVNFITELSSQSEDTLVTKYISQLESSSRCDVHDTYSNVFARLILPLINLIDSVHVAMREVEQLASTLSSSPPPASITQQSRGKKNRPTPPPTIMSISHLRGVYTAVEVLWCWGVEPLLAAATITAVPSPQSFSLPTYPKSMIIPGTLMHSLVAKIQNSLNADMIMTHASKLWRIVLTIEHSVRHLSLRSMMLQRNFSRLVLAAIAVKPYITPSSPPLPSISSTAARTPEDLLRNVRNDEDLLLYIQALQHVSRVARKSPQREAARLLTHILLSTVLPCFSCRSS